MINWKKLIDERNAWIAHNFPNRSVPDPGESLMGMIEELGELTHAVLKSAQAIRGDATEHADAARDAVGDITVYMLGVMSWAGMRDVNPWVADSLVPNTMGPINVRDLLQVLSLIDRSVDQTQDLANPHGYRDKTQHYVGVMVAFLIRFCQDRDWNYDEIVNETWNQVKTRDWIKYPNTGRPETLASAIEAERQGDTNA